MIKINDTNVRPFSNSYYVDGEDRSPAAFARKVDEEASEVVAAVDEYVRANEPDSYSEMVTDFDGDISEYAIHKAIGDGKLRVIEECMDTMQAIVNLLCSLGVYEDRIMESVYSYVRTKNLLRRDPKFSGGASYGKPTALPTAED